MRDNRLWFDVYGMLEHISKQEYLRGPYRYVCTTEAEDGCIYDVVRNTNTDQEYFTEI